MKGRNKPKPAYVKTMSDITWLNADLIERASHVARSQERLKVREVTENWGGMVTVYLKTAGWISKAPWCAAFVYWCLLESGADKKKLWKNPASTLYLWKWAHATKRLHKTFPADRCVGVYNSISFTGHTWIYLNKNGETIEGNTNVRGAREGIGVFERKRPLDTIDHYPRWGCVEIGNDLYE